MFEASEESEYDLLGCEMVGEEVAEMHIDPHAYPMLSMVVRATAHAGPQR